MASTSAGEMRASRTEKMILNNCAKCHVYNLHKVHIMQIVGVAIQILVAKIIEIVQLWQVTIGDCVMFLFFMQLCHTSMKPS